ncbi:unnamed protein product [Ranitomeya imitator]|uniref:Replication factor C subunit 5 n=1 Tax=Ranitomeya imitator TaxID=111125 RepID=A0ABN9L748_9NEOB|nr:unnamed protein product [Ranitomeya imitator]
MGTVRKKMAVPYSPQSVPGARILPSSHRSHRVNAGGNGPRYATVIEKFTENTRFCMICNYLSKIIPALQSRCTRFRFGPLSSEMMVPRLEYVVQQENVDIAPDGMKALVTLSSGDMRRALNILQSTNMAYGKVTEDTVYTCTGHPLKVDIANILDWMLNKDFTTAYKRILSSKCIHKGTNIFLRIFTG